MKFSLALAVAIFALSPVATVIADPLGNLLAENPGGACYQRVYDKAHLARHPKQATRAVLLSLQPYTDSDAALVRVKLDRAKGSLLIAGGCGWADPANRDIEGTPLIAAFKAEGGLDCHAETSADGSSAEEGGDFPIDLGDGVTITLYLDESLAGWTSFDRRKAADFFDFGRDDRVFRLQKIAASKCSEMNEKTPWE